MPLSDDSSQPARTIVAWDMRPCMGHRPTCPVCGCGGDWHYEDCPKASERGDKIVIDARVRDLGIAEQMQPIMAQSMMCCPDCGRASDNGGLHWFWCLRQPKEASHAPE